MRTGRAVANLILIVLLCVFALSSSWGLALFSFLLLILFHEWGHYIVGKSFGFGVKTFAIGFTWPFKEPILKFTRGETEYRLGWWMILGGYCQFIEKETLEKLSSEEKAALKLNHPEQLAMLEDPNRYFTNKPLYQKLAVIVAGPAINLILAIVLASASALFSGVPVEHGVRVGEVQQGSTADEIGMESGDLILVINDTRIGAENVVDSIRQALSGLQHNQTSSITVERDGMLHELTLVPKSDSEPLRPLGVSLYPSIRMEEVSPGRSLTHGWSWTVSQTDRMISSLAMIPASIVKSVKSLASGEKPRGEERVVGLVGIVEIGKQQAELGIGPFLMFLALLNLVLAVMNLLPIPPLDGGNLVFQTLFSVTSSAPKIRTIVEWVYMRIAIIAMMAFLLLMVVAVWTDIKMFGG